MLGRWPMGDVKEVGRKRQDQILKELAAMTKEEALSAYQVGPGGLREDEIEDRRQSYGENKVEHKKEEAKFIKLLKSFADPFTYILIALVLVSLFTDVIFAEPGQRDFKSIIIITLMVVISGVLKFVQESKSSDAAEKLLEMIENTAAIERQETGIKEIPFDEIVVGDLVYLSAGDMIPADIRILEARDLFISQSSLTGESEPVEKFSREEEVEAPMESGNLAFMGTNVLSGSAKGLVVSVGKNTILGNVADSIQKSKGETGFEKGLNQVSWVLIKFIFALVPVVFFINGFTKGDWIEALLFAISIAVGLTPEMLPMIVTTSLAKGAISMSKKQVIIKNLNSIQNLGAIDILCTDKTGTLTEDKIALQYHLNIEGESDINVLRYGLLNSYYQTGLKNLMDLAIIDKAEELKDDYDQIDSALSEFKKIDEVPFDFNRRRMSVLIESDYGLRTMITKGAVEEMLDLSSHVELDGKTYDLDDKWRKTIEDKVKKLNDNGFRVIAVAKKTNSSPVGAFSEKDECDMTMIGYLAFLDPPKKSAMEAIKALEDSGVDIKIITGDNLEVTLNVCKQLKIDVKDSYLGADVEKMSDEELYQVADKTTIFAKMSPAQKRRVVKTLREEGHVVAYMGDGINDAGALDEADVGISVDNAVDIAKESADVILLEKDLMVLENGILEGRKTYINMIKYIKLTASSNFGNVFSILVASILLPFLPMVAIQILLLNLINDLIGTAIPWDNVDEDMIRRPRPWNASSIGRFMVWIGPVSSIFDVLGYFIMYFFIAPYVTGGQTFKHISDPLVRQEYIAVFHAGWFLISMWTQTFIIQIIRTDKKPFVESVASSRLNFISIVGVLFASLIPYLPLGKSIGFAPLPLIFYPVLIGIVVGYSLLLSLVKSRYIKRFGSLL